jgi:Domain of unknown function (DUF4157)/Bacterial toxin 28
MFASTRKPAPSVAGDHSPKPRQQPATIGAFANPGRPWGGVSSGAEAMEREGEAARPAALLPRSLASIPLFYSPTRASASSTARGGASSPSLTLPIQAKLEVGAEDDPLEREADAAAEMVMDTRGGDGDTHGLRPANHAVQRLSSAGAAAGIEAPASAVSAINQLRQSGGSPLAPELRAFYEQRMGEDFGPVRVHTGPAASGVAEELGAKAFTIGKDIVFGEGHYRPATSQGKRLIAHELSHVVQQTAAAGAAQRSVVQRDIAAPTAPPKVAPPAVKAGARGSVTLATTVSSKASGDASNVLGENSVLPKGTAIQITGSAIDVAGDTQKRTWIPIVVGDGSFKGKGGFVLSTVVEIAAVPEDPLSALIKGEKYAEAFNQLATLDDVKLTEALKRLHNDDWLSRYLGIHFDQAAVQQVDRERILRALDAVEFSEKDRYIDNFNHWHIDPSSFSKVNPEQDYWRIHSTSPSEADIEQAKRERWNIKLYLSYPLTPERNVIVFASDVLDSEASGDELVKQSRTHLGANAILLPEQLNKGTAPRLWAAKKRAIEMMEEGNLTFVMAAHSGAELGMAAPMLGISMLNLTQPVMATGGGRPSPRRLPSGSGSLEEPGEPTKAPAAGEAREPPPGSKPNIEITKEETPPNKPPPIEESAPAKAPKVKTVGTQEDQISTKGLNDPVPLTSAEQTKVYTWQNLRNSYLKTWSNFKSSFTKKTQDLLWGPADRSVRKNMTPDDLAAVIKENRGVKITDSNGKVYDHLMEAKQARNSIKNTIIKIQERLQTLDSGGAEPGEREALQAKMSDLSKLLDSYERLQ